MKVHWRDELNALYRAELAEKCTAPYGKPPPEKTYPELSKRGLLHWAPGWRLTDAGRQRLNELNARAEKESDDD